MSETEIGGRPSFNKVGVVVKIDKKRNIFQRLFTDDGIDNVEKILSDAQSKGIKITEPEPENYKPSISEIKQNAKQSVKQKFYIGHIYRLNMSSKASKYYNPKEYRCIKYIYTVKDVPVNIVIMKCITPHVGTKFTLNYYDCQHYHIKYEPGLEVFSMDLNWTDLTYQKKKYEKKHKSIH